MKSFLVKVDEVTSFKNRVTNIKYAILINKNIYNSVCLIFSC